MIITKLCGGNGNQMFQYAAGLSLSKRFNTALYLDINYLLDKRKRFFRHENRDYAMDIFNITGRIASNQQISTFTVPRIGNKYIYHIKKRILRDHNVFREKDISHISQFTDLPSDCYIEGYWQNPIYFAEIEKEIRIEFAFKNLLPETYSSIMKTIRSGNSTCIIFRRGDFVNHPLLDIVGLDYYDSALKILSDMVSSSKLFIFSDDIPWCRAHFNPPNYKCHFVEQSLTGPKAEYYLQMISTCDHFIIPNSTFAWWGAWLNDSPSKIVIAPRRWFKGQVENVNKIVPKGWITI